MTADGLPAPVPPRVVKSVKLGEDAVAILNQVSADDGYHDFSLLIRTALADWLAQRAAKGPADRTLRAKRALEGEADRLKRQRAANAARKKNLTEDT